MMKPSDKLRDIAGALRAMIEEGALAPCEGFVQQDIGALPRDLERLADEVDGRREAA